MDVGKKVREKNGLLHADVASGLPALAVARV